MAHSANITPKNLVICCDGTGNEISQNISNALKLDRYLRETEKTQPRQMVSYGLSAPAVIFAGPFATPRTQTC